MSSDRSGATEETDGQKPPLEIVSVNDFRAVSFEGPIADIDAVDCHALHDLFNDATNHANQTGDLRATRVFGILASLCSFHFKPDDPADPFGPMMTVGDRRTATPRDFRGAQSDVVAEILPEITHPGLRARLADTVWFNNRSKRLAADIAVGAYGDCLDALLDGRLKVRFDTSRTISNHHCKLLLRALQIAHATNKGGIIPERLAMLSRRLFDTAVSEKECSSLSQIGRLLLRYDLIDPSDLAAMSEQVALTVASTGSGFPLAVKSAFECSAYAYGQAGDEVGARRCRLAAVEQTLAMKGHVSSAAAQSSWIRTAINQLRDIPNTAQEREALRLEMRDLQHQALDEMGSFTVPIDFEDMRSGTTNIFDELSLPTALGQFALLSRSRPPEELKKEARDGIADAPFYAMLGGQHIDVDGKVIAETPGVPTSGEPSDEWYKATIAQNMRLRRSIVVGGFIDPARRAVASRFPLSNIEFLPIVELSPFVPQEFKHTFALGFARFMQGDFISAAHLLIPQLESSIRHVLTNHGIDTSKIKSDMIQEDRPLSALLENYKSEMERVFSEDLTFEIDLLFNHRAGPALRHDFAHGKVSDGYCFGEDVIYACWFIYHLTCFPLVPVWKIDVARHIEAQSL